MVRVIMKKDYVLFGKTDKHEDIISQHKVHMDGIKGPNGVCIEVTPPNKDFSIPFKDWIYKVDQDVLPDWYESEQCEKRVRYAMETSGIVVLYADYEAKRKPLNVDYKAKRDSLYADYEAKRDSLYADYEAKRSEIASKKW